MLNINIIMKMGFKLVDRVHVQLFFLNAAYKKKKKKDIRY